MPLAYVVAAAAPLDTAAASTSTVTTLLARDPTVSTLDNAMFGLGKGVGLAQWLARRTNRSMRR